MNQDVGLRVNGKAETVAAGASVADLAEKLGLPTKGVAIAMDGEIVPRSAWTSTLVNEGSSIEVVSIAAGG